MMQFWKRSLPIALMVLNLAATTLASAQPKPEEGGPPVRRDPPSATISAEFPYEPHYVEVLGSRMHYVSEGEGQVFVMLHGNPTSSYLWRNVIPYVAAKGRAVAPDLIGMGKSDKPDLPYRFDDHYRYLHGLIQALELQDIILVVHDWGSGLGLHYAAKNPDNVRGVVMMEAIIPNDAEMQRVPRGMFAGFRHPVKGPEMIMAQNAFVEMVLPMSVHRKLTDAEMNAYRAPFPTPESRKPVYLWPNEIPFADGPEDNRATIRNYVGWLGETDKPKLLLYADPGAIIPPHVQKR